MSESEKPKITYRQLNEAVDMSVRGKVPKVEHAAVARLKGLGLITASLVVGEFYGSSAQYEVALTPFARDLLSRTAR